MNHLDADDFRLPQNGENHPRNGDAVRCASPTFIIHAKPTPDGLDWLGRDGVYRLRGFLKRLGRGYCLDVVTVEELLTSVAPENVAMEGCNLKHRAVDAKTGIKTVKSSRKRATLRRKAIAGPRSENRGEKGLSVRPSALQVIVSGNQEIKNNGNQKESSAATAGRI